MYYLESFILLKKLNILLKFIKGIYIYIYIQRIFKIYLSENIPTIPFL